MKTLTKFQIEKAKMLLNYYGKTEKSEITLIVRKLSDFYSSRSTKYANCLDSAPFIIKTDVKSITEAGYSKLCKAAVSLDLNDVRVVELISNLVKKNIEEKNTRNIEIERTRIGEEVLEKEFDVEKIKAMISEKYTFPLTHKQANSAAFFVATQTSFFSNWIPMTSLRSRIKNIIK